MLRNGMEMRRKKERFLAIPLRQRNIQQICNKKKESSMDLRLSVRLLVTICP